MSNQDSYLRPKFNEIKGDVSECRGLNELSRYRTLRNSQWTQRSEYSKVIYSRGMCVGVEVSGPTVLIKTHNFPYPKLINSMNM